MTKQTILITGASGRIGSQLVAHFLKEHCVVALTHTSTSAETLQTKYNSQQLYTLALDLTAPTALSTLQDYLMTEQLAVTALINNARSLMSLAIEPSGLTSALNFSKEFQLGVIAAYDLTMQLANANNSALKSVINMASMYGVVAINSQLYENPKHQAPIQYGVVKAALIHLTKELAIRLAPQKIRVNAVSFGGVEGRADQAFQERYAKLCPQGRMLTDNDLIGPVNFLLNCDEASAITGHNLVVDGGWSLW